jgi:hypothetical protein
MPFMVREPHHERHGPIENSRAYPFALSLSKGSEQIATQASGRGGARGGAPKSLKECAKHPYPNLPYVRKKNLSGHLLS